MKIDHRGPEAKTSADEENQRCWGIRETEYQLPWIKKCFVDSAIDLSAKNRFPETLREWKRRLISLGRILFEFSENVVQKNGSRKTRSCRCNGVMSYANYTQPSTAEKNQIQYSNARSRSPSIYPENHGCIRKQHSRTHSKNQRESKSSGAVNRGGKAEKGADKIGGGAREHIPNWTRNSKRRRTLREMCDMNSLFSQSACTAIPTFTALVIPPALAIPSPPPPPTPNREQRSNQRGGRQKRPREADPIGGGANSAPRRAYTDLPESPRLPPLSTR